MSNAIYDSDPAGVALADGYASRRRPDPRIAAAIVAALTTARTVVNVGAGSGSYEPSDRDFVAVEPSARMIAQRSHSAAPCVRASAEELPFRDGAFEAAMAVLTIHHWTDWRAGLAEMARVAQRRVILLTFDAEASDFWLTRDYFPEIAANDRRIMPKISALSDELGPFRSAPVLVPHDCLDGFLGAYWRRPHVYLDPAARAAMSPFAGMDVREGIGRLEEDLRKGVWRSRSSALLEADSLDVGYRLVWWDLDRG